MRRTRALRWSAAWVVLPLLALLSCAAAISEADHFGDYPLVATADAWVGLVVLAPVLAAWGASHAGRLHSWLAQLSASETMGRLTCQRWFEARPLLGDRVGMTNTYITLRDGEVVREEVTRSTPFGLDEETIVDEIPVGAFSLEETDQRYLAVRRLPGLIL